MRTRPQECVAVVPLLAAREGELSADERDRVDAHVAACGGCRALAADLAAMDGMVHDALLAEAARRDFAPFVDRVMERVAVERPSPVRDARVARRRAVGTWAGSLLGWARSHRAVAAAGTLVPTLAAVALIVYFSTSGAPVSLAGEVEVVAEGRVPVVLQTSEGPVVLLDGPDAT